MNSNKDNYWRSSKMFLASKYYIKVEKMAENPVSCDIKKLKGSDYYRLRVGDYRIIFIFDNNSIKILKVGHRKNIYEK
jgi:mRNA interferase RelE/StbE